MQDADARTSGTATPSLSGAGADDAPRTGAGVLVFAWVVSLAWLGLVAATVATTSATLLSLAQPWMIAAGAVFVWAPPFMILVGASALREAARARATALQFTQLVERLQTPTPEAEASAKRLSVSVRGEIAALERAVDQANARVKDMEGTIARQAAVVEKTAQATTAGAREVMSGLELERAELAAIFETLRTQAAMIGETIHRHGAAVADAARRAEAQVSSADKSLNTRLAWFEATTAMISERAQALGSSAGASAEAALRLEEALARSQAALAQAASLTDQSRRSAEAATHAAVRHVRSDLSRAAPMEGASAFMGSAQARAANDQSFQEAEGAYRQSAAGGDARRASFAPPRRAPATSHAPPNAGLAAVMAVLARAGVSLHDTFDAFSIDAVANASRLSADARRHVVRTRAGLAVTHILALANADLAARRTLSEYLASHGAEMNARLRRGRADFAATEALAFLLVDAALG